MSENRLKCSECGKIFGSKDTFLEHSELDHNGEAEIESLKPWEEGREKIKSAGNRLTNSFGGGVLVGLIIASTVFSGFMYWNSMDHRTNVPVTVVICDSCEYDRFKDATDRMFKTSYREVDYQSEEGQRLIQEHNLKYVPGFLFERQQLEKAENFTAVKPTLVESGNSYVIPDEGSEVAQRLSTGMALNRSEAE